GGGAGTPARNADSTVRLSPQGSQQAAGMRTDSMGGTVGPAAAAAAATATATRGTSAAGPTKGAAASAAGANARGSFGGAGAVPRQAVLVPMAAEPGATTPGKAVTAVGAQVEPAGGEGNGTLEQSPAYVRVAALSDLCLYLMGNSPLTLEDQPEILNYLPADENEWEDEANEDDSVNGSDGDGGGTRAGRGPSGAASLRGGSSGGWGGGGGSGRGSADDSGNDESEGDGSGSVEWGDDESLLVEEVIKVSD
ncbi:unnamed protein product, partial [Phaeothamnion confervicola]